MASSISIQSLLLVRSTRTHVLFLDTTFKRDSRVRKFPTAKRKISRKCISMAAEQSVQGPSAAYAKDMERLSAKESLLLAFKDAGGFEAFMSGKTTNVQRIDVNERIVGLERLNPTPRPTASLYLEGQWNFKWFGSGSPGLYAARRFPPAFARLSKLDLVIKDGYANVSASVKLLNSIASSLTVSTRLSIEGPLRMKEEYIEGIFESPKVDEDSIPEQLRGAFGQAASQMQQLPIPITDALAGGLKVPLGGTFERLFMISYLDDEILIIRDADGVPEVLTRLYPEPSSPVLEPTPEYES